MAFLNGFLLDIKTANLTASKCLNDWNDYIIFLAAKCSFAIATNWYHCDAETPDIWRDVVAETIAWHNTFRLKTGNETHFLIVYCDHRAQCFGWRHTVCLPTSFCLNGNRSGSRGLPEGCQMVARGLSDGGQRVVPEGCQMVVRWWPEGCQTVARGLPDGGQRVARGLPDGGHDGILRTRWYLVHE